MAVNRRGLSFSAIQTPGRFQAFAGDFVELRRQTKAREMEALPEEWRALGISKMNRAYVAAIVNAVMPSR